MDGFGIRYFFILFINCLNLARITFDMFQSRLYVQDLGVGYSFITLVQDGPVELYDCLRNFDRPHQNCNNIAYIGVLVQLQMHFTFIQQLLQNAIEIASFKFYKLGFCLLGGHICDVKF